MSVMGISALGTATAKTATNAAPDDGFSFFETIIDTLNPLQHIPIVSSIYRNLTGDTQNGLSHIVGNTLFGGPISGAFAVASEVFKAATGDNSGGATQTALAATTPGKADQAYKKAGAMTTDWIYPGANLTEAANNLASAGKIRTTTKEWLSA